MSTTPEETTAVMKLPSAASLADTARQATIMVADITVRDDAELQIVTDDLRAMKVKRDGLEALRLTITRPMDQAKAAVMDLFRGPIATIDTAIEAGKRACLTYTRARDARLREEQRQREEAAASERRALEAKAVEAARAARTEAEAKAAQAIQAQAAMTVAPIVAPPPKVAGSHTAKRWTATVTDKRALVEHLLTTDLFDSWVQIDATKPRQWATLHDGKLQMPGLSVDEATSMVLR